MLLLVAREYFSYCTVHTVFGLELDLFLHLKETTNKTKIWHILDHFVLVLGCIKLFLN